MEKQVTTMKKALAQLDTRCGEISDQRAATVDNIHVTFRRLQAILNVRETEMIGQLDQITQGKLKGLTAQRDQIETTIARLYSCLHFMRESLRTGNKGDVLMMKVNSANQVQELTTPFQPDILEPNTEADIVFSASADMTEVCQNYGQVFTPGLLDPSSCHVTVKGAEIRVGEKSTAMLQAINFEGQPFKEPIKLLECELVSEITGTRASCSVERRGQSQYEISYQPTIKGRHQLHVKVEGQHVKGSLFSVAVKLPVERLGTQILAIEGVVIPWDITINRTGEVVVSEVGGKCISVFSPGGKKIQSFGTLDPGCGQLKSPSGVAVDGKENILVVDNANHCIKKFTRKGHFLTQVGTEGKNTSQFYYPTSIAFNTVNNKIYVTESRIQVLNSDLTFFGIFGKQLSGDGQLWNIACDSNGKMYVAENRNHRIQVFTAEGEFLRMFGRRGRGRGELDGPVVIAVGTSGMVYVSEEGNHRVSVFTSEGKFVTSFGRRGEGPGEFDYPCGLAVDNSGVLFVCDRGNNRVQVF